MELFGFCSIRCGVGIWGKFVVSDRLWLPTGSVPFLTCQERNRKKQPEERRNLFSFGTAYRSALFSPRKKCPLLWTLLQRYALIVFFLLSLLCRFATEDNLQFDLQIPIYRTVCKLAQTLASHSGRGGRRSLTERASEALALSGCPLGHPALP